MSRNSAGRRLVVNERVEIARYTVSAGGRVLYAQRIDRLLCVTDRPASGSGRSYLVEYGLDPRGSSALEALVADYTRQAAELDQIPMAASIVRRTLAQESVCSRVPRPLM